MAKIHRSDAPLPQAPSAQVKASYTVTELPKVSPQEPAAFYDQDNDELNNFVFATDLFRDVRKYRRAHGYVKTKVEY